MTGGGAFAFAPQEEYDLGAAGHSVQWVGTPGVKGPSWARLPLLTVGMLGTQVVWSVEMGYASPYLLELGLSKSWMSLVFVAGPLSGLIVQPLIGAYADRCRSRFGRRRPFMLAGTGIACFGMMLLAWSREIASFVGLGAWAGIACAVFAIYLIDFSINAVMATDRALIVDTLPSSQQEEGNAWAGRMIGIGGVAGFFVGNVDVTQILFFLGKTQLQILSFLTSFLLATAHFSTSWAVTERVLLRDDRHQSRSGLWSSLRAIWENIFSLPPSIRTICFIQFFANLGWYPVMFYTSLWIANIYKENNPQGALDKKAWDADAVRSGNRALFLQAVICLLVSVVAPFLVAESGIQSAAKAAYTSLPSEAGGAPSFRWHEGGGLRDRLAGVVGGVLAAVRSGSAWALPVRGLTLIRVWIAAQCIFVACMLCTWFTSTVGGGYALIAVTGFAWALAQWAPFALLGELVLLDVPSAEGAELDALMDQGGSQVLFSAVEDGGSRVHSRTASRTHSRLPSHEVVKDGSAAAARITDEGPSDDEHDTTVVLRHSGEDDSDGEDEASPRPSDGRAQQANTADKAGLILGIHNVFIVMPQFVITAISSLVFYLMEPDANAPAPPAGATDGAPAPTPKNPDAVGLVFRIGGTAAAVGAVLSYRLARRWARGEQ